jgi:hypothetical protein
VHVIAYQLRQSRTHTYLLRNDCSKNPIFLMLNSEMPATIQQRMFLHCLLSKNTKIKLYRTLILPFRTRGFHCREFRWQSSGCSAALFSYYTCLSSFRTTCWLRLQSWSTYLRNAEMWPEDSTARQCGRSPKTKFHLFCTYMKVDVSQLA